MGRGFFAWGTPGQIAFLRRITSGARFRGNFAAPAVPGLLQREQASTRAGRRTARTVTNPKRDPQTAAGATTAAVVGPVGQRDRIFALDVLRGVGLLGILVMNISSFGLHEGFDFRPSSIGDIGKLNMTLWAARFALFEGKMRGIFTLLFGAGVVLLTSRMEKRGETGHGADIFARRNLWLVAIGLAHGYFLWFGDILYAYGVTALLFLYPCRKVAAAEADCGGTGGARNF